MISEPRPEVSAARAEAREDAFAAGARAGTEDPREDCEAEGVHAVLRLVERFDIEPFPDFSAK